jgi:hypothetical protein
MAGGVGAEEEQGGGVGDLIQMPRMRGIYPFSRLERKCGTCPTFNAHSAALIADAM